MYGKNKTTKQFLHDDGRLLVHSVFGTLQGEGPDAGRSAVFVRLGKCNLRCWFCDTEFEEDLVWYSATALLDEVLSKRTTEHCDLVVITGGEPLAQNLIPFTAMANRNGLQVSIETAGTLIIPELIPWFGPWNTRGNKIVCSPKTPGLNPEIIPLVHSWKYILRQGNVYQDDGLPFGHTQARHESHRMEYRPYRPDFDKVSRDRVYVQPMDEGDDATNARNLQAAVGVCLRYGYRLSVQTHKLAGLP